MLKTFAVAFRLRNTYKANSVIWSLKGIPLVRKLLPSALYASRGLKVFANIIAGIMEFISVFIGKVIYLCVLWWAAQSMNADPVAGITHAMIFTTVIGGFLNTRIFDPSKDKYYAIFLMRMDAKEYTLTDYLYFLLKMLIGFSAFSFVLCLLGAPIWTCISLPLYVILVKLCFSARNVEECKKTSQSLTRTSFRRRSG